MNEKTILRFQKLYGWVLSAAIFAAGICLMIACVGIYHDGAFSREAVAIAFSHIRIPVYLCLVLVLGSFLVRLLPGKAAKGPAQKQYAMILERLEHTTSLSSLTPTQQKAILWERKLRSAHRTSAIGLTAAALGGFLLYCLTGDRFHQSEITQSMIQAMCVLLPGLVVSGIWGIFTSYRCQSSMIREIELLKQAAKGGKAAAQQNNRQIAALRMAVLTIAVAVLVFGFATGGANDVLTKAVNICTECVGLG